MKPSHALDARCQDVKRASQPAHYFAYRRLSLPITRILVKTRISANQVSAIGIGTGILSGFFLIPEIAALNLAGIALLYANFLLDKVDGEVARYRNHISVEGMFLDEINHTIVPLFLFGSLAVRVGLATSDPFSTLLAFLPAPAFLSLRLLEFSPYKIFSLYLLRISEPVDLSPRDTPVVVRIFALATRPLHLFWRWHYLLHWLLLWVLLGPTLRLLPDQTLGLVWLCAAMSVSQLLVLFRMISTHLTQDLRAKLRGIDPTKSKRTDSTRDE